MRLLQDSGQILWYNTGKHYILTKYWKILSFVEYNNYFERSVEWRKLGKKQNLEWNLIEIRNVVIESFGKIDFEYFSKLLTTLQ